MLLLIIYLLHSCHSFVQLSNNFSYLMPPKLKEMDEVIRKIHVRIVSDQNNLGRRTLLVCYIMTPCIFLFPVFDTIGTFTHVCDMLFAILDDINIICCNLEYYILFQKKKRKKRKEMLENTIKQQSLSFSDGHIHALILLV